MDTYSYRLTEEEYYDYAKNAVIRKGKLRTAQVRVSSLIPVISIILVVGFRLYKPWMCLCALLISVVWIVFTCWLFQRSIRNKAESYCQEHGRPTLQEICLQLDDQTIRINRTLVVPNQYLLLKGMMILYFTDGSELIVPLRIFNGNQEQMQLFLKKVIKIIYINGNQGEKMI